MNVIKRIYLAILIGLVGVLTNPVQAQETNTASQLTYYLATGHNGVQQVFQLLVGEDQPARQLTHVQVDVINFGVADDALGIAYVSNGQIWLQSTHTDEAEALATLVAPAMWTSPIFSQDGNYLAYEDQGVWLYDLANRQAQQILKDVPLADSGDNTKEFRIYQPQAFVTDASGAASKLIVDVGTWEWNGAGVYDLSSGKIEELAGQLHTDLLALSDGRVLIYGNSGVAGEGSLYIADSLDAVNTLKPVIYFADLTEATLFAEQAVEIGAGIVRVFGQGIALAPNQENPQHFYFDFDTNSSTVIGDVQLLNLASLNTYVDKLSPDGSLIVVYQNPLFADAGMIYGELKLIDPATRETVALPLPEVVSLFRIQSR